MRTCLSKFILACTDAGDGSTIDEQISACDKTDHRTQFCCLPCKCLHTILLQDVHLDGLHIVATAAEILADTPQCLLADVAQQDFLTCTDTAHNGCSHTTGTQESHNCFLFVSVDYLLQEIVYHAYFQRNKCNEYIYLSSTNPLLKFYSCPTFLAFLVRLRITLVACCR